MYKGWELFEYSNDGKKEYSYSNRLANIWTFRNSNLDLVFTTNSR